MSEWKRVFLDPRRLFLFALMTILGAGLFVVSLLDRLGPGELTYMREANAYAERLAERWQDRALSELPALAAAELDKLNQFDYWYYGYDWYESPYETEEEAYTSIADMPVLVEAAQSGDGYVYYRVWASYQSVLRTMAGEIDYLLGYADYLDGIQKQAEIQSQTSLFGKPGSFSRRNLAKTAAEFDALRGVEVQFGGNRGLECWRAFDLGDYFHLIAIVMFVMAFLDERKKGLWPIVRTAGGGRARLGLTRIGILCAASVLATILFCAVPFVLSLGINGGWDGLSRSLQSLASFRTCTLRLSIVQWLGRYFVLKSLSGVLIGLFLWCVLGLITNIQFSLSVLGAVLVGEYALYAFLPVQSALNVFKYFNIFTYVHTFTLFTEYLNVDLFGFPVGIRELALAALAVLGAALAILAVLIQRNRRPEGNRDLLSRISLRLNRVLDALRSHLTVGGWEVYKSLVFQYGIIILLVVLFAASRLTFVSYTTESQDKWYIAYVRDMEGPLDEMTDEYLAHARESIPTGSEDAGALMSALMRLENQVSKLRGRAAERGYQPWILDDSGYDLIYGPTSRDRQRLNGAAAMILAAFCCAAPAAYERQSGVAHMVRSTKKGRGGLLRRKVLLTALLSTFVWAAVYAREVQALFTWFQPRTLDAPVQNIDALAGFPVILTVTQYLILLYAIRLVMLLCVGFAVLLISHHSPSVQAAYLISAGILGIPALLTVLGIDVLKWVSPLVPVSSAELMWGLGSGNLIFVLPWVLWLVCGTVALWLCRRRWVRGSDPVSPKLGKWGSLKSAIR